MTEKRMIPYLRRITLIGCDILAIALVAGLSLLIMRAFLPEYLSGEMIQITSVYVILGGFALFVYGYRGHYSWRTPWWQQVRHVAGLSAFASLIHILINYALLPVVHAQIILLAGWAFMIPVMLGMRLVGRIFLKRMNHWNIATVVVGNVQNVIDTVYALKSEFYQTYDIRYVVLTGDGATADQALLHEHHPALSVRQELDQIHSHSMIILCLGENDQAYLQNLIPVIKQAKAKFAIVPPTSGFSLYGLHPQYFFGYNIVLMEPQSRLKSFSGRLTKNILDRGMALLGLIMLAPVFLFLIYKVRKDGGPAFYSQLRIGKDGNMFKCWKFRSMVTNSQEVLERLLETDPVAREEWAKDFKLKNDPRITKIGHILRKSSLDEIPQLWNVLRGDMSIVGPRPIVKAEESYYGDRFGHYLSVRPGITGLWQVSGRNDVTYEQRVALDSWYVENWSVWNDLVIIFKTTFVVLNRKGAY